MSFVAPIGFSGSQGGPLLPPSVLSALKESMIKGVKAEGSFPVSESLINKLSVILGDRDSHIGPLVELILADPILSLRLVSLSNFPAYSRGRPALSVTSAVQQFGFRRVTEIVRGLSHNRNLAKAFHERAIALHTLSRLTASVAIAARIARELSPNKPLVEEIVVLTAAANLPELLTAFYIPHVYAACWFDASLGNTDFSKSFRKLFLQSITECGQEMLSGLSMPKEYSGMMSSLEIPPWNKRSWGPGEGEDHRTLSKSVFAAQVISQALFQFGEKSALQKLISEISSKLGIASSVIEEGIGEVAASINRFKEACGFPSVRIPVYALETGEHNKVTIRARAERLGPFLGELKNSLSDELEPTEIGQQDRAVLVTLLGMVEALDFDRAVLLVPDGASGLLKVGAWFGLPSPQIANYRQKISVAKYDFKPELQAFHSGRAVFMGDPLFGEDWPFAAFPVVRNGKSVAIFYGDRASNPTAQPLDSSEQVTIVALAEAWQNLPMNFR